jgi:hypothetical protein
LHVVIRSRNNKTNHIYIKYLFTTQTVTTLSVRKASGPSTQYSVFMSVLATRISNAPTEILEKILDFLHDDHAALYAASLVSRAWVSRPRYHLFGQIVLHEYVVPDTLGAFIETHVTSFLALARSEHCTIIRAIRRLILMILSPELLQDVIDSLVRSDAVPTQIVYNHINSASVSWNGRTFQSVHDFTFNMERRDLNDAAWHLVSSFPSLRTLALYTKSDTTVTLPRDMPGASFHSLRTLRLRLVASEELLHWLKNINGSHFALETFDLRMIRSCHSGWGPVKALNAFLKSVSGTLKHLSLGIDIEVFGLDPKSSTMGTPSSYSIILGD